MKALEPHAPKELKKAIELLEKAIEAASMWHVGSAEARAREAAELLASLFRSHQDKP